MASCGLPAGIGRAALERLRWIFCHTGKVPLVTSDAISPYEFDQFSGEISFAHIGIDRSF